MRSLLILVAMSGSLLAASFTTSPLSRRGHSLPGLTPLPKPTEYHHHRSAAVDTALPLLRGGATSLASFLETPRSLFHSSLVALALLTVCFKVLTRDTTGNTTAKPVAIQARQRKFLAVFWLLRCADWLQGPYFYEVYASKIIGGVQASMALVSRLFLTGFASTALFGPSVGRAADQYGRKKATLVFTILYALGAMSTQSTLLTLLFLGRVLSGIGTSLLFSAPESWLVGAFQKEGDDPDGTYLGETFGMAYAGDSVVAITAGQLAAYAASSRGPTGPFELSTVFLLVGGLLASLLWKENVADSVNEKGPSISDAIQVVKKDPKIVMVGGVQSLFEAAMYIFVLQWPPAAAKAIANRFGAGTATPYGTIFSCFMACCLLGSTLFGQLAKMGVATETSATAMLAVATVAMTAATSWTMAPAGISLLGVMAAFFVFEACVGMYFPSIGTLRSKYIPDSHRSVIMNLFGIPLNVLVVSVFLSIQRLGLQGALSISSGALAVATLCMIRLRSLIAKA